MFLIAPGFYQDLLAQPVQVHTFKIASDDQLIRIPYHGSTTWENSYPSDRYWNNTYRPLKSFRLENVGTAPILAGSINFSSTLTLHTEKGIAQSLVQDSADFKDFMLRTWQFIRSNHVHHTPPETGQEPDSPLKSLFAYGYGFCSNVALVVERIGLSLGLFSRYWELNGHTVSEITNTRGDSYLIDTDLQAFYLKLDNKTLASKTEVTNDKYLIWRTKHSGKGAPFDHSFNSFIASLYGNDDGSSYNYLKHQIPQHDIRYRLRPGEAITFSPKSPQNFLFSNTKAQEGLDSLLVQSVLATCEINHELNPVNTTRFFDSLVNWSPYGRPLKLVAPQHPGILYYSITSPFPILESELSLVFEAASALDSVLIRRNVSGNWEQVYHGSIKQLPSTVPLYTNKTFSEIHKAIYELGVELSVKNRNGQLSMSRFRVNSVAQTSKFYLPKIINGNNYWRYRDQETSRDVRLTVTLESLDQKGDRLPRITRLSSPGKQYNSSELKFQWEPPSEKKYGKTILYEFILSAFKDFRYPFSSTFEQYTSTPDFTVPVSGLLNPGERYYWRVRAKSDSLGWGPWSKTMTAVIQGVLPVEGIKIISTPQLTLAWNKNKEERSLVKYHIYGGDDPSFILPTSPFYIGEVTTESFVIEKSSAKKAYRVVACNGSTCSVPSPTVIVPAD